MITTITGTGIIEAATVTPIMMTITGTKITIMITRRRRRKLEGEADSHNRWVALFKLKPFSDMRWFDCGTVLAAATNSVLTLTAWSACMVDQTNHEHWPHSNTIISEPSGFEIKVSAAGKSDESGASASRPGWLRYDVLLVAGLSKSGARDDAATPTLTFL